MQADRAAAREHGRRILVPEHVARQHREIVDAAELAGIEGRPELRDREGGFDRIQLAALALRPARQIAAGGRSWEQSVDHDRIGRDTVEAQIGERAARLLHHDAGRVHHQARRGPIAVDEDPAHVLYVGVEPLDGFEELVPRNHTRSVDSLHQRAQQPRAPALQIEEVLHEDAQRVGKAQHAKGRAGGRAVDHADVEVAGRLHLPHRSQGHQLLETRKDQELLGEHLVGLVSQELPEPAPDLRPGAIQLLEDGHLPRHHARGEGDGTRSHPPPQGVA